VDKQHSSVNFVLLPEQTPAGVLTTTELHRANFSCFIYFLEDFKQARIDLWVYSQKV